VTSFIAYSAFTFIGFKVFFSFLAWFASTENDRLIRKKLDSIWDRLQGINLFDLMHRVLQRLVERTRATFPGKKRAVLFLTLTILGLNFLAWMGTNIMFFRGPHVSMSPEFESTMDLILFRWVDLTAGFKYTVATFPVTAISAWVTWALIVRAAESRSLTLLIVHLLIDVVLAIAALYATRVVNLVLIAPYSLADSMPMALNQILGMFEQNDYGRRAFFVPLALAASAPTIAYMSLSIAAVIAFLTPKAFQHMLRRVLYLVSTDNRPVLDQVGNVAGAAGVFLVALISILGSSG
jgi:hypothetical protein